MTILSLLEVIMKKYVFLLLVLGGYIQGMYRFNMQTDKPQPTPEFYDARAAFGDDVDSDEEYSPFARYYESGEVDSNKPELTLQLQRQREAAIARDRARADRDRYLAPRQLQFDSDSE